MCIRKCKYIFWYQYRWIFLLPYIPLPCAFFSCFLDYVLGMGPNHADVWRHKAPGHIYLPTWKVTCQHLWVCHAGAKCSPRLIDPPKSKLTCLLLRSKGLFSKSARFRDCKDTTPTWPIVSPVSMSVCVSACQVFLMNFDLRDSLICIDAFYVTKNMRACAKFLSNEFWLAWFIDLHWCILCH